MALDLSSGAKRGSFTNSGFASPSHLIEYGGLDTIASNGSSSQWRGSTSVSRCATSNCFVVDVVQEHVDPAQVVRREVDLWPKKPWPTFPHALMQAEGMSVTPAAGKPAAERLRESELGQILEDDVLSTLKPGPKAGNNTKAAFENLATIAQKTMAL